MTITEATCKQHTTASKSRVGGDDGNSGGDFGGLTLSITGKRVCVCVCVCVLCACAQRLVICTRYLLID